MVLVTQSVTSTISLSWFIFIEGYCVHFTKLIAKAELLSYRHDCTPRFWGDKPDSMHTHLSSYHLATLTQCAGIHHGGSLVSPNTHSTLYLLPPCSLYDCATHHSEQHDLLLPCGWRSWNICTGLSYCCQHCYITLDISFISLQKNSMPLPKVCSNMSLQMSLKSNELVKLTPKSSMRLFWDLLSLSHYYTCSQTNIHKTWNWPSIRWSLQGLMRFLWKTVISCTLHEAMPSDCWRSEWGGTFIRKKASYGSRTLMMMVLQQLCLFSCTSQVPGEP